MEQTAWSVLWRDKYWLLGIVLLCGFIPYLLNVLSGYFYNLLGSTSVKSVAGFGFSFVQQLVFVILSQICVLWIYKGGALGKNVWVYLAVIAAVLFVQNFFSQAYFSGLGSGMGLQEKIQYMRRYQLLTQMLSLGMLFLFFGFVCAAQNGVGLGRGIGMMFTVPNILKFLLVVVVLYLFAKGLNVVQYKVFEGGSVPRGALQLFSGLNSMFRALVCIVVVYQLGLGLNWSCVATQSPFKAALILTAIVMGIYAIGCIMMLLPLGGVVFIIPVFVLGLVVEIILLPIHYCIFRFIPQSAFVSGFICLVIETVLLLRYTWHAIVNMKWM